MPDDDKVKISCSHCKASFLVPGPAEGKKFRCPKCKEIFSAAGPSKATRTSRAGPSTRSVPKLIDDEEAAGDRKPTRRELAQKKREDEAAARAKRMKVIVPIVVVVAVLAGGAGAFFWWKSSQAEEKAHQDRIARDAADEKVAKILTSARTLLGSKSFKEAAITLGEAVKLDSKHKGEAQIVLGAAKVGMRDFAGAISDIDAAIKALPDLQSDWEAHYYRGAALLATRRETEALEDLQLASRCEHSPPVASQFAGALSDCYQEKRKALDAMQANAALLPQAPAGLPPLDPGAFDLVLIPDVWDRPGWRLTGSTEAAAIIKEYRPDDFPIPLLVLRDDTPFGAAGPTLRKLVEKGFKKVAFAARVGGVLSIAVAGLSVEDPGGSKVQVLEGGKVPSVSGDVTLSVAAFARPSELATVLSACARSKAKPTIWLDPASQDAGALAAALLWLARHQESDGHWGVVTFNQLCTGDACHGGGEDRFDLGVTALAALAFLEAGIAPGDTRWPGFGHAVDAALGWLVKAQQGDGSILAPGTSNAVFPHVFATLALVQAARTSKLSSPDGGLAWKEPAQKAVSWLEGAIGAHAWGYAPGDPNGDTTVTGWALLALAAGRAAGLTAGDAAFDKAIAWTDAMTEDREFNVRYNAKQWKPQYAGRSEFPSMAAHALIIRLLVAGDTSGGKSKGYASLIAKALPQGGDKSTWDYYYWHVGTPAMWLLDGASSGPYWRAWTKAVGGAVAPSQCSGEECSAGSWQDEDPWSKVAGRVYCTAINAMTLSVLTGRDTLYRGLKLGK